MLSCNSQDVMIQSDLKAEETAGWAIHIIFICMYLLVLKATLITLQQDVCNL